MSAADETPTRHPAERPDYRPISEIQVIVGIKIPGVSAMIEVGEVMADVQLDVRRDKVTDSGSLPVAVDVVGALRDLADQIEAAAS